MLRSHTVQPPVPLDHIHHEAAWHIGMVLAIRPMPKVELVVVQAKARLPKPQCVIRSERFELPHFVFDKTMNVGAWRTAPNSLTASGTRCQVLNSRSLRYTSSSFSGLIGDRLAFLVRIRVGLVLMNDIDRAGIAGQLQRVQGIDRTPVGGPNEDRRLGDQPRGWPG